VRQVCRAKLGQGLATGTGRFGLVGCHYFVFSERGIEEGEEAWGLGLSV